MIQNWHWVGTSQEASNAMEMLRDKIFQWVEMFRSKGFQWVKLLDLPIISWYSNKMGKILEVQIR